MAAVRLLSEHLINRIAAGEVVERPASVLKELLENSLDAGATRVEIEAKSGGRNLIRVSDNGQGMSSDDLLLAIERHATSKLSEDTDLLNISTLGFRGEALPSIGAVSRLTIATADTEDGLGRMIRLSGGKLLAVEDFARDRGTTVEVRDLFYNVPARKKFLKSVATESAHLSETAAKYALGNQELGLVYRHNGQIVVSTSQAEDPLSRVARVLGKQAARNMVPFESQNGGICLSGFLGKPAMDRARSDAVHLFVNGRPVSDRLLLRAVLDAYRGRLMKGRYPYAVIFLTINPEAVDVNVHPAKAEVRFRHPQEVFPAVRDTLLLAMGQERGINNLPGREPAGWEKEPQPYSQQPPITVPAVAESMLWQSSAPDKFVQAEPPAVKPVPFAVINEPGQRPEELWAVGHLFRTYILAQGKNGLYIVDHHAAHERILFDQFKSELAVGRLASQSLLMPVTLELSPTQAVALETALDEIRDLGFELEHFGGNTFVLRAVPAVMEDRDPHAAIMEIIDEIDDLQPQGPKDAMTDSLLKTLACHSSVRAGHELTTKEMDRILSDLSKTSLPTHCPHGRPLMFFMGIDEIRQKFKRT